MYVVTCISIDPYTLKLVYKCSSFNNDIIHIRVSYVDIIVRIQAAGARIACFNVDFLERQKRRRNRLYQTRRLRTVGLFQKENITRLHCLRASHAQWVLRDRKGS